jgi:hypothetical protein
VTALHSFKRNVCNELLIAEFNRYTPPPPLAPPHSSMGPVIVNEHLSHFAFSVVAHCCLLTARFRETPSSDRKTGGKTRRLGLTFELGSLESKPLVVTDFSKMNVGTRKPKLNRYIGYQNTLNLASGLLS